VSRSRRCWWPSNLTVIVPIALRVSPSAEEGHRLLLGELPQYLVLTVLFAYMHVEKVLQLGEKTS